MNYKIDNNINSTELLLKTSNLKVYETKELSVQDSKIYFNNSTTVTTTTLVATTICQHSLCCKFNISMTNTFEHEADNVKPRGDDYSKYYYRIAVFDGIEHHLERTAGLQVCAIIPCIDDNVELCGKRADDSAANPRREFDATYGVLIQTRTVFESIDITAFIIYNDTFVFPELFVTGSGTSFGALVSSDTFSFKRTPEMNNTSVVNLKTQAPINKLITAAIYARQFFRDDTTSPATNSIYHFNNIILFLVLICNIL